MSALPSGFVRLDARGQVVQIRALLNALDLSLDAALRLDFQLDAGDRLCALLDFDRVEVQIGGAAGEALHRDAAHRDLLDELLGVSVERIQPVDLVVLDLVGRRVAEQEERVEVCERLLRLRAPDLLRLIDDHDRPVRRDDVDGLARLEVVEHIVDAPVVLPGRVERLDVDDHHLHPGVRGERLELVQAARVVDEHSRFGAVALLEVLGGDVEGLLDALADRDARDNDDVLRPAVALVQLHDRLDVDVRLARPGLHLDVEVELPGLARHERRGRRQALLALRLLDLAKKLRAIQRDLRVA